MENTAPWFRAQSYDEQRQQILKAFGVMLRRWREANGWTQHTAHQWGKSAGFHAPSAGKLSYQERGQLGAPSPGTIMMLSDLNARIAAREWGAITNRRLRDRVEQAKPITDPDGTVWGPIEFWGASAGLHPIPEHLQEKEVTAMPEVDPAALCQHWRELLAAAVLEHDLDASAVITAMARLAPPELQRRLRQVLAIANYHLNREDLPALWADGWLPEHGLTQVLPQD